MKLIDKRYMDLLFEEAKLLPPVGRKSSRVMAALVFKKTLVIYGKNEEKTDPMQQRHSLNDNTFIHAEIMAIKRALNHFRGDKTRLTDATLYVVRAKKAHGNGSKPSKAWCWGNSKPCAHCDHAIKEYGIKRIVFSLDENHTCGEL